MAKVKFELELSIPVDMEWFFSEEILKQHLVEGFRYMMQKTFSPSDAQKFTLDVRKVLSPKEVEQERILAAIRRDSPWIMDYHPLRGEPKQLKDCIGKQID